MLKVNKSLKKSKSISGILGWVLTFFELAPPFIADPEGTLFTLVDSEGDTITGQQLGLLLYLGGTVCDDRFNDTAAEAICSHMNKSFTSNDTWRSGVDFTIQSKLEIKLDDVQCRNGEWENCSFSRNHNCGHHEDIFLSCTTGTGMLYKVVIHDYT